MKFKMLALAAASILAIEASAAAAGAPAIGSWGYDSTAMDSSVKPGDDFFEYVNGSWLKRTEIPADRTFAGIDSVLNDKIDSDVRAIVEDLARNPQSSGRVGQQVGDMYASWMDVDAVEKAGTAPLEPYLKKIAAVKTRGELVDLFGSPEYESPISIGIYPDFKDPTHYMVYANQGGLGLPNRDYYLLKEDKYVAYRKAYRDYIVTIEKLAGIQTPRPRRTGSSLSKPRLRKSTGRKSRAAMSRRSTIRRRALSSPPLRRSSTGTGCSRNSVSPSIRSSSLPSPVQSRQKRSCSQASPFRRGRTGAPSIS